MAALTANPHSALRPGPSWDETIVPSLRKRLESESRILTKRLSTISITDEGTPSVSEQSVHRAASPPQNYAGDYPDANPQRPSAIPRPSYSAQRPTASPSPPPAEPARKPGTKRQRTQSTPFPFNNPASSGSTLQNGHVANGMPMPSTSGSTSPRVQSPPLARSQTPSRIPTVASRVRSGSQSSQGQGFGSLNGAKSSLPPSHKFPSSETSMAGSEPTDSFTPASSLRVKPSSSSLARQRIVDERPPFTNEPPPRELEHEFTGRPSADEERTYQHWYRGDVSRNGGVGEYRVGKRMEMLDIANFGHDYRTPSAMMRAFEEPTPRSEGIGVGPRKRAESVSSRERASIYIDPQDEGVTGRVLDEMPLTDIEAETDYERDQHSYSYEPQSEFDIQHLHHPVPPTNHNRPGPAAIASPAAYPSTSSAYPSTSSTPSSSKSQTRIPQSQPRSRTPKATPAPITATPSEPTTPAKPNSQERGRAQAPVNPRADKTASKAKAQKRSKSAADALRPSKHEQRVSKDYSGLADAVPETSSPAPRDGNWDEVILPTVARRMGIEYEKEDPEVMAKRKARVSRVAPAPGTFGYDHTKYKPPTSDEHIPLDEFGQRPRREPTLEHSDGEDQPQESAPEPPMEDPPARKPLRLRRETMPSPAPFSHYAEPSTEQPDMPDSGRRGRRKERHDVPQILISAPTMEAGKSEEEEESAGCCKCVVM